MVQQGDDLLGHRKSTIIVLSVYQLEFLFRTLSNDGAIDQVHIQGNFGPGRARNGSVLNRVGSSQSRWQQQLIEQRRNIYDRHSILN